MLIAGSTTSNMRNPIAAICLRIVIEKACTLVLLALQMGMRTAETKPWFEDTLIMIGSAFAASPGANRPVRMTLVRISFASARKSSSCG